MFTNTIKGKLIFYFIIPIVALGLLYFGTNAYYTQDEFLHTLERQAINTSSNIADHIKDALFVKNLFSLTDIVFYEKYANSYVSHIEVFDATGEAIAYGNLDTVPGDIFSDPTNTEIVSGYPPYETTKLFSVDRPIISGLYKIGMIRIKFDFSEVLSRFNYIAYLSIAIGLLLLGVATLFMLKMVQTITHPIESLTKTVTQFSQGDSAARAHSDTKDEIGNLATSFNTMANTLQSSKELLEHEKKSLEDKVAELEKWQLTTVGRELKMVELKKIIANFEQKNKK